MMCAALGLNGCGFHSLYGGEGGLSTAAALERVEVVWEGASESEVLATALRRLLGGLGAFGRYEGGGKELKGRRWRASVRALGEERAAVVEEDSEARRVDYVLSVRYQLWELDEDGEETASATGSVLTAAPYTRAGSGLSDERARLAARDRAARRAALEIRARVATALEGRKGG